MKIDISQLNRPQSDCDHILNMSVRDYLDIFGMTLQSATNTLLRNRVREEEIRTIAKSRKPGMDSGDQRDSYAHRMYPWGEDIVETAKSTKTMRVYFTSNEGQMVWAGNLNDTEGKNWGDSTVIAFPDGQVMLIDVGINGYGKYLVENLKAMGVKTIDYLVFSHPHDDHCYSITDEVNVLNSFPVRHAYYTGAWNMGWSDRQMIEHRMNEFSIPLSTLSFGDALEIGDARIDVLAPCRSVIGTVAGGNDGVNNLSIVLRVKYKNRAVLFTGDINHEIEQRMLDDCPDLLRADILKIQHHGAANANTREFIAAVQPKAAYGMAWKFIHPEVVKRYNQAGCQVFNDMFDGYMRVVTDGDDISWQTSRKRLECVDKYYKLALKS